MIRLGTRGSALALAQARLVAERLGDDVELVPITTTGDRQPAGPPAEDKSRFVKEIDEALLAGAVDLAVHSAKDVPGHLPEGIVIAAVPAGSRVNVCRTRSRYKPAYVSSLPSKVMICWHSAMAETSVGLPILYR